MLTDQLIRERPDVEAVTVDGLAAMGGVIKTVSEDAPRLVFFRAQWVWDLAFWLFASFRPTRLLTRTALGLLGSTALERVIRREQPDVIVSTYPQTTEVLGQLRRRKRISVPVCSAITDLAAMDYWAAPGVDLHLVTHPESIPEVVEVAGPGTEVIAVQGFTDPAFLTPRSKTSARETLGLPPAGRIVLVSGGGWGVGDLPGAVECALSSNASEYVVCLCGQNDQLRAALTQRHRRNARVRIEGFTDEMPEWLAAADVLVHSTGGLTVLEALMRGCPVISYGWGRGHIRRNNEAFVRYGLATVASDRHELEAALRTSILDDRTPNLEFAHLPSAASKVLALASGDGEASGDAD
ncbi:MAG TPA: glycosyltransferase [Gaiellaceae bacterium]|nr:glycosyltransferase [Gaiellaceae bacterium]